MQLSPKTKTDLTTLVLCTIFMFVIGAGYWFGTASIDLGFRIAFTAVGAFLPLLIYIFRDQ